MGWEEVTDNERINKALQSILDHPMGFPDEIAMVKILGKHIETPDFALTYKEHLSELKTKYEATEQDYVYVITQRRGGLEIFDISLVEENPNKEAEYSNLQVHVARSIKTECYIMNGEEANIMSQKLDWDLRLSQEDQIKRYAVLNPGYTEVTDTEKRIITRYSTPDADDDVYSKEELLEDMIITLYDLKERGKAVNYAYIANELLRIAEQGPDEA
jgi:hypothetical protein